MFRKLKLKTPTLVLVLLFGSISAFCQSSVFSVLQTQVNALTTSTAFATVVSVDTKVTEAAAANLITPEEFETLDASIRTIYRTSTSFSVLGYGNMPNDPNHSVRGASCVIKWHNTNKCQGAIKITNGATVVFITEDDNKSQRIYRDGADVWPQAMITVEKGSTLIIKGSKEHPLIIDGGAVLSGSYENGGQLSQLIMTTSKSGRLVHVIGTGSKLMASNATFQNNYSNDAASGILFQNENLKTASFFQSSFYNIWTKSTWTGPTVGTAILSSGSTYQEVTLADESKNHGILMNHCHFKGNINDNAIREGENAKLQNGGSCFAVQGGTLNLCLKNCLLESNYSSWHGGAIFWNIADGTLDLEGTTFTKNYGGLGAAVYVQGSLNLSNCTFTDNHAVIQNKNNPNYEHPAYVEGNGYDGCGGALYIQPSNSGDQPANCELKLTNCIFDGNSADLDGGAILLYMVQNTNASTIHDVNVGITIDGTTENMLVQNNTAGRVGGALALTVANELMNDINTYNLNASIQLNGGKLCNNSVTETFDNDRATFQGKGYGGGLFLHYAPVTIGDGFEIVGNTSAKDGGALYVANGNVTVTGGTIRNNNATNGNGGGIYATATISISGTSSITNNTAGTLGGGIYANGTIKLGAGNLTVMENHCGSHSVKNNIYLPKGKELTVIHNDFNPQYVGIYAENTVDYFPVINYGGSATTSTLQAIYGHLLNGTCNVFDDKQTYSPAYNETWAGQTLPNTDIYFIKTPWTPLQRQTTAADNLRFLPGSDDTYEVNDVKSLTAFLWHVNGISTHSSEEQFTAKHPAAKAKVTADIPMVGRHWVPIGTSDKPFTGTFDGGGHIISDLTMVAANASTEYGMFGNVAAGAAIKNVVLRDCLFTGTNDYAGSMVYKMNGGTLSDCQAHGVVNTASEGCTIGGLVGLADGGEIHSCYSCIELSGYNMGGLVGETANGSSLKNSFASPKFQYLGSDATKYIGGLVGINAGTTANCYVRELAGSNLGSASYGTLVGNNTGSVDHCFAMSTPFNAAGNAPASSDTYTAVIDGDSYQYRVHDCTVSTTGKALQRELNTWVDAQTGDTKYAKWNRPTTKAINGDYPLLKMTGNNAVTEDESGSLLYGNVNTLLGNASGYNAVWFYGSEPNFNAYSGNKLYIDEDAALTQSTDAKGPITATVGITLDNSAGPEGANPSQGGDDAIDWHFFSTSLSDAPLGIDYTIDGVEDVNVYEYEDPIPKYQHTGDGYFPTGVNNIYYDEWDFYAYYEPEFQWINFKRNSNSHWNEIAPWVNIPYNNNSESKLIPGMGYMVALADPKGTLLQCTGTLKDGDVAVPLSCAGYYRKGLNLLGNPYQSYLDFEAFVDEDANSSIWPEGTSPYYIIMDEDLSGYIAFAAGQSKNTMTAGKYIHPHQGFMVVTGKPNVTANFNNDMRVTDLQGYDAPFRGQQVAYPLVNLIATDANGNRDIATAELGRPDKGGAILADFATLANCLVYVHYDDKDYRIAFTQQGISSLPVRFEAFEAGTFTLTWDMENGEFSYLHLIDNITGADVDMLTAQEYTFTASTDDLRSRFKLVFDYTGIDENGDADTDSGLSEVFAYMSNGQLVVEGEGTLQLIDMNGRVLQQARLHGDVNTVDLPQMAAGLYVLKLDERTQKIVLE